MLLAGRRWRRRDQGSPLGEHGFPGPAEVRWRSTAKLKVTGWYDHRLRELVRKTQGVSCAVQYGVPRSTARSRLTTPSVQVVTADPFHMDAIQLQQEVLHLRTRIQKLMAVLRVLLVVLKISKFSLNQS